MFCFWWGKLCWSWPALPSSFVLSLSCQIHWDCWVVNILAVSEDWMLDCQYLIRLWVAEQPCSLSDDRRAGDCSCSVQFNLHHYTRPPSQWLWEPTLGPPSQTLSYLLHRCQTGTRWGEHLPAWQFMTCSTGSLSSFLSPWKSVQDSWRNWPEHWSAIWVIHMGLPNLQIFWRSWQSHLQKQ